MIGSKKQTGNTRRAASLRENLTAAASQRGRVLAAIGIVALVSLLQQTALFSGVAVTARLNTLLLKSGAMHEQEIKTRNIVGNQSYRRQAFHSYDSH